MKHQSFPNRSLLRRAAFIALVLVTCTATRAQAQTLTTLHSFDNTDGASPQAGLIQATDGNFYGTTEGGGAIGAGTVFKITPSGTLTTLYSFCPQSGCTDGANPRAALAQGTDGNFYGTTSAGGANLYYGTVFKITPSGSLTTLYSFCSQSGCMDGAGPLAGLVQAADGNFYGTTNGGTNFKGTVFKITPSGTLTTLYSFCSQFNCMDGQHPLAAMVQGTDGNLYGTTASGGASSGHGTVFKITPSGTLTTLYSFCSQSGCTDGAIPQAGLVQATDGNFYGTTASGGAIGAGTIFKITPSGMLTTLYSFCSQSGCTDGANPRAALVQVTDGNFYGTTLEAGANGTCTLGGNVVGCGTVFKISPGGTLTTLQSFDGTDGATPFAALVQATDGNFYGTTAFGGASACAIGCGTVFKLTVQTSAPTITGISPTSAIAGGGAFTLTVNGTNFVSGSTVDFNGNARATTFVSSTQLTAAILASDIATAGTFNVTVTNPGGGTSNLASFAVNNPAPTITSLSPSSALVDGTAFTLTVNGTGFVSTSVVNFGANARVTAFVSATQLTAAILASDIATAGNFSVTVTNPAPGGGTSNAASFTVLTPQQATQTIINAVNALFSQGVLNGGQDNSLVTQLQHAITMMNAGKNAGAIGNLESFISEVNDLLSSGVLSPSQAASLINAAQSVIAALP